MMRQRSFPRVPSGGNMGSSGSMRTRKGTQKESNVSFWVLLGIVVLLGGACVLLLFRNSSLAAETADYKLTLIEESNKQVKDLTQLLTELQSKNDKMVSELETQKYEKDQLLARSENLEGKVIKLKARQKRLKGKADGSVERHREQLELQMSRQRWGTGNVYIDFKTDYGSFRMKMAPFNVMPHTTSWFLTLAESGYWEGCGFIRNAMHILQANCNPKEPKDSNEGKAQERISIAFQEYNDNYQHRPYTFGIAGRPGGPDWYINLIDNSGTHGPGGQPRDPEADPCFAELVSGKEVIKKLHKLAHDQTAFKGLVEPVIFRSVRVVTEREEKTQP